MSRTRLWSETAVVDEPESAVVDEPETAVSGTESEQD